MRWIPPMNWRLSSQIDECHGRSWFVAVSIQATPVWLWPLTKRPVCTTRSLLLSWVRMTAWTFRLPLVPMPPDRSLTNPVTTAPVVAFTAARPTLAVPLIVVKLPPTYTVVLVASTAVVWLFAFAVNPVFTAPVVGLIEAILRFVTPSTVLNVPTTKSLVPSGMPRSR